MRILILHDEVPPGAPPDAADAIVQARLFEQHLIAAGHAVTTAQASLDLTPTLRQLSTADLVVNLVESLAGHGCLIHLVPTLVEAFAIPMTGCPAAAIACTSNKLAAKRAMCAAGIPTPEWFEVADEPPTREQWIIKSVWEHASIGLTPDSIVDASAHDPSDRLTSAAPSLGGHAFAERFIEGREFNLSILETDQGPMVLPPAEIRFLGYAPGKPRIVDYAAKWDESSFEYHNTPRSFDFSAHDTPLLEQLSDLALRCWHAFNLRGYARVDFRIDNAGNPHVLEVNTNPCVSPDAGFIAAAERAGLAHAEVITRITAAALRPADNARKIENAPCSASAN